MDEKFIITAEDLHKAKVELANEADDLSAFLLDSVYQTLDLFYGKENVESKLKRVITANIMALSRVLDFFLYKQFQHAGAKISMMEVVSAILKGDTVTITKKAPH